MNMYTLASRINKSIRKQTDMTARNFGVGSQDKSAIETIREKVKEMHISEFDDNMELAIDLMLRYKEIAIRKGLISDGNKVKQTYFITIRPDDKSIDFEDFYTLVSKFVARKCFVWFKLSFEQKGKTSEDYGKGFHCHIIANMRQRSKSEVLRDTISTFKCCTSANCIQVDLLKNSDDVENTMRYLTEYESDDGHKKETMDADKEWRRLNSIQDLYTEENLDQYQCLPSIKSNVGQANSGTLIVDLR